MLQGMLAKPPEAILSLIRNEDDFVDINVDVSRRGGARVLRPMVEEFVDTLKAGLAKEGLALIPELLPRIGLGRNGSYYTEARNPDGSLTGVRTQTSQLALMSDWFTTAMGSGAVVPEWQAENTNAKLDAAMIQSYSAWAERVGLKKADQAYNSAPVKAAVAAAQAELKTAQEAAFTPEIRATKSMNTLGLCPKSIRIQRKTNLWGLKAKRRQRQAYRLTLLL
jgi:hypothetical protein